MAKNSKEIESQNKEKELRLTLRDDFFYGIDTNAKITFVSADVEQLTNLNKKELIGKPISSILYHTNNDKNISFSINNLVNTSLKDGKTRTSENEIFYRKDGSSFSSFYTVTPIINEYDIIGAIVTFKDIQKEEKEKLIKCEDIFRSYFEVDLIGMAKTSLEKGWMHVNNRLCEIVDYTHEELFKLTWAELTHPDDLQKDIDNFNLVLAGKTDGYTMHKRFITKTGNIVYTHLAVKCIRNYDGSPNHFIALVEDITELKKAEKKLKQLAHHDQLTGLATRYLVMEHISFALIAAQRNNEKVAILFIDLDGFKRVNDTLGHATGDRVLIDVSKRLTESVRGVDMVSRFGGDEFIIVIDDVGDRNSIALVAQKILDALALPIIIESDKIFIGASIGIALYPDHGQKSEELLKYADKAMYKKGKVHILGMILIRQLIIYPLVVDIL